MNRKLYLFIVIMLMIIEFGSLFLTYKSFQNKPNENKINENITNNNMFAIMLDDGSGEYKESEINEWPGENYVYNKDRSGCIDKNGNVLENVLTFDDDNNIALLTTKTSAYCYLYFDLNTQTSSSDCEGTLAKCLIELLPEGLNPEEEGGLKRFQGTTADNYICFGTSDKNTCRNNTDAYMYRIIGIDSDNRVKIIKKEALNSAMKWHSDSTANTEWNKSSASINLNGSSFLSNTTYVPSGWSNKIVKYDWKYGDNKDFFTTAAELYEIENNWAATVSNKIGLMYMYDYYYAYQSGGLDCYFSRAECKTSWIYLSNNDLEAPEANEWTMSRDGLSSTGGGYLARFISSTGRISAAASLGTSYSMRPVFFLTSTEKYVSGIGTINDPFILEEPNSSNSDSSDLGDSLATCNAGFGECLTAHPTGGLNTTMEAGLYRYQGTNDTVHNYICFGTSTTSTCTGNKDRYMYRIIGIDSSGRAKLIKKEALNSAMAWGIGDTGDLIWPEGTAFKEINDSSFLNNTTYVTYEWSNKIVTLNWKYGDIPDYDKIGDYTPEELYQIENGWSDVQGGQIGLMYLHDYYYAYPGGGLKCNQNGIMCKDSWIHLANNDTTPPDSNEWTISRFGFSPAYDYENVVAFYVHSAGGKGVNLLRLTYSVRPVFFLTNTVKYVRGSGTLTDPFIIE